MRLSARVGRRRDDPGRCPACGGAGAFVVQYEGEPAPRGCRGCGRLHTPVRIHEAAPAGQDRRGL